MFDRVVKYLDLRKANRDTTLVTKPFTLRKARAIKKINIVYNFALTQVLTSDTNFWDVKSPQILAQWNVSAEDDFRILNVADFKDLGFLSGFWRSTNMAVKFRVGNEVTRYFFKPILDADGQPIAPFSSIAWPWYYPIYNGEVIKKNFCVEMWQIIRIVSTPNILGFITDNWDPDYDPRLNFRFVTSMLRNPAYAEETARTIEVPVTIPLADVFVPYNPFLGTPVTFPIERPDIAWLDNA